MPPRDVLALAKRLKGLEGQNGFRWARRVLHRARDKDRAALAADPDLALALGQQHALCTYKDPDLPVLQKLHAALDILKEVDNPDRSTSGETLGQTGAIHKRLWEVIGQKTRLERSYAYYRSAYDQDPVGRNPGYCGINAAFVLDLLAHLESREAGLAGAEAERVADRRREAARIRRDLADRLAALENERGEKALHRAAARDAPPTPAAGFGGG